MGPAVILPVVLVTGRAINPEFVRDKHPALHDEHCAASDPSSRSRPNPTIPISAGRGARHHPPPAPPNRERGIDRAHQTRRRTVRAEAFPRKTQEVSRWRLGGGAMEIEGRLTGASRPAAIIIVADTALAAIPVAEKLLRRARRDHEIRDAPVEIGSRRDRVSEGCEQCSDHELECTSRTPSPRLGLRAFRPTDAGRQVRAQDRRPVSAASYASRRTVASRRLMVDGESRRDSNSSRYRSTTVSSNARRGTRQRNRRLRMVRPLRLRRSKSVQNGALGEIEIWQAQEPLGGRAWFCGSSTKRTPSPLVALTPMRSSRQERRWTGATVNAAPVNPRIIVFPRRVARPRIETSASEVRIHLTRSRASGGTRTPQAGRITRVTAAAICSQRERSTTSRFRPAGLSR
jgi:hypothetical protein